MILKTLTGLFIVLISEPDAGRFNVLLEHRASHSLISAHMDKEPGPAIQGTFKAECQAERSYDLRISETGYMYNNERTWICTERP